MLKNKGYQFLNLSDKAKKIVIVCFIVLSSIFISGFNGVGALSNSEALIVITELKEFRSTLATQNRMTTDEYNSFTSQFSKKYNLLHAGDFLIICSKDEDIIFLQSEDKRSYKFYLSNGSYFPIVSLSTSGSLSIQSSPNVGFGTSGQGEIPSPLDSVYFTNCDVKDPNGNVVFQKPVEPLISPTMVGVLPETIAAELSVVLPIGLAVLSAVLLIFLLNRWRKSLNL